MATWIMVAHRAGARLYERTAPAHTLQLLREFDNPDGRKRDGDFDADRPGRANQSQGQGRNAMRSKQSPIEHASATFAKRLAEELTQGRHARHFDDVVLVAEPQFLGDLRAALDDTTAATISASVAKDFASVSDHELQKRLVKLLATS